MHGTVYLDGRFVAAAEAKVSIFDRGFLFGDAAYTGAYTLKSKGA